MKPGTLLPRLLVAAAIGAVLLGVFSLYTRPEFLVALSEQMWACFQ
ncbi:MAG: hypothetical protein KA795_02650 [Burkholderiaceae bacterium]|nr:hypothetical protein [Burkholderiaceae bacterium]